MLNTPNVIINRFESAYKIGAARLAERKGSEVIDLLEFLIEKGLDINIRKNEKAPTLLESFINALFINYDAIEYIIRKGARKDVKHSWAKNPETGEFLTLTEFVNQKKDERLKQIFMKLLILF